MLLHRAFGFAVSYDDGGGESSVYHLYSSLALVHPRPTPKAKCPQHSVRGGFIMREMAAITRSTGESYSIL